MRTALSISRLALVAALASASTFALPASAQTTTPDTTPAAPVAVPGDSDIIVTGSRVSGLKAADSAAPIQVLGTEALTRVGQPNLNQILALSVPSFTSQTNGADTANLTLSARLRGLSPNHTLILINGKRRHGSANLQAQPGAFQGGAAADLDLIPPSAIKRIEILQDGAAAQYGSDAIAGVINIILNDDTSGGTASVTAGQYYKGDGDTLAETGRIALPIGKQGYFDLTAFHRFHDYSARGGADRRIDAPDGSLLTGVPASYASLPGYPNLLTQKGDARTTLTTGLFNAGYDFGGVEAYSFGSYSRRNGISKTNYRLPNRVVRTVNGVTTQFAPNGFLPTEGIVEDDYAITGGLKGLVGGWNWDLSTTYGKDKIKVSTLDSADASLYVDTGFTPTNFYDGAFMASEWTTNLDLKHEFAVGFAEPLTVALGTEYRRNTYGIRSGDPLSIYKEGAQTLPGFNPTDAGDHTRHNWSAYIDLAAKPIEAWSVDLAGRFEDYSDFGSKVIGKLTTRYDFSPAFALRGTVSNGFRAPTLAEEYYSATQVGPTSANVVLPSGSAAAAIVGFRPLKAETSTNLSVGMVVHPVPALTMTLDAYQIKIDNRIVASASIIGKTGTVINNQAVLDAIAAHGNTLDPTVTSVTVQSFANGIDTRSRGIDFAASYPSSFGFGRIDWSLNANYNSTKVTNNRIGVLFNSIAQSIIENVSPKYKVSAGALVTSGQFSVNLRETLYGKSSLLVLGPSNVIYEQRLPFAPITDLELSYKPVRSLEFSVGANNLFNKNPATVQPVAGSATTATAGPLLQNNGNIYNLPYTFGAWGSNGGYYYGRVTINF